MPGIRYRYRGSQHIDSRSFSKQVLSAGYISSQLGDSKIILGSKSNTVFT